MLRRIFSLPPVIARNEDVVSWIRWSICLRFLRFGNKSLFSVTKSSILRSNSFAFLLYFLATCCARFENVATALDNLPPLPSGSRSIIICMESCTCVHQRDSRLWPAVVAFAEREPSRDGMEPVRLISPPTMTSRKSFAFSTSLSAIENDTALAKAESGECINSNSALANSRISLLGTIACLASSSKVSTCLCVKVDLPRTFRTIFAIAESAFSTKDLVSPRSSLGTEMP